jgi:putative endonuclease
MAFHNDLGKKGEELAVIHLIQKGYQILERNWRFRKAEIDIIALKGEELIIVEVKTRTSEAYGKPQEFVNRKKIEMTIFASNEYVLKKDLEVEVRFDIISVIINQHKTSIEHIESAFLSID